VEGGRAKRVQLAKKKEKPDSGNSLAQGKKGKTPPEDQTGEKRRYANSGKKDGRENHEGESTKKESAHP